MNCTVGVQHPLHDGSQRNSCAMRHNFTISFCRRDQDPGLENPLGEQWTGPGSDPRLWISLGLGRDQDSLGLENNGLEEHIGRTEENNGFYRRGFRRRAAQMTSKHRPWILGMDHSQLQVDLAIVNVCLCVCVSVE